MPDDKIQNQNVFQTIDSLMRNLHLSKKIFLIMIVTIVIFPPSLMIGSNLVAEYLRDEGLRDEPPRLAKLVSLANQLEKGEISTTDYVEETRYVKDASMYGGPGIGYYVFRTILILFTFWMCYGAIQWFFVRKWNNSYRYLKDTRQNIIEDTSDDEKTKAFKNIFEIADNAIRNLHSTKKIFFVIVIVGFLVPQLLPLVHFLLVVEPIQSQIIAEFEFALEQLENGDISVNDYVDKFRTLKAEFTQIRGSSISVYFGIIVIIANAIFLTGYGIKQWIAHTKWNKKYQKFLARDDEINKKFDEL